MTAVEFAVPLGRTEDFTRAWDAINKSPLTLIVGNPGSGRSTLLHSLVGRARAEEITLGGSLWDGISEYDGPEYLRDQLDPERVLPFSENAAIELITRLWSQFDSRSPERLGPERLYVVDGYRPTSEVDAWFTAMARNLLASRTRGDVVVVVGAAETLGSMIELGPEVVELGPLNEAAVRSHLSDAAQGMEPPLTDRELETYSSAASANPSIVSEFVNVFSFAKARRYERE